MNELRTEKKSDIVTDNTSYLLVGISKIPALGQDLISASGTSAAVQIFYSRII